MDEARCRGLGKEGDIFFAETPSDNRVGGRIIRAKLYCARCPVRRPCLDYANRSAHSQEDGIYAGTTAGERKRFGSDVEGLLRHHAMQAARHIPIHLMAEEVQASLVKEPADIPA